MSLELPAKPNLEHLRKQAKDLLRQWPQGNAATSWKLADAQHAIARNYGFATWPKLKEHVDSLTHLLSPAEMLCAAVRDSDAARTARVLATHPELKEQINEPMANYAVQRSDRKTNRQDTQHHLSALGSALHGSENSWHRQTGDYGATVQALLDAGARAPKLTDDLEASQAVRDVLRRHEEGLA